MTRLSADVNLASRTDRLTFGTAAKLAAYAAAFVFLFALSDSFEARSGISLCHPPAALRLAVLILYGWRAAPLLAITEFLALLPLGYTDFWFPEGDDRSQAFRVGGMLIGAVIPPAAYGFGVFAATRLGLLDARLSTVRHVLGFYLAAATAAILAAVANCLNFTGQGFLTVADLGPAIVEYWSGDVIAATAITPCLLIAAQWVRRRGLVDGGRRALRRFGRTLKELPRQKAPPFVLAGALAMIIAASLVSASNYESPLRWYPLFLPVIWLALYLGIAGAAVGILAINLAIAALAATSGQPEVVADIQLFILMLSAAGLLLAAAVEERDRERLRLDARVATRTRHLCEEVEQRRQAEVRAQIQSNRAERYLAIARMWIVGLDDRGRITLVNDEACRMLGYARHELLGHDWFTRCVPGESREVARRTFGAFVAGTAVRTVRHRGPVMTRRGETRLIDWRVGFDVDPRHGGAGCLGSGLDVTDKVAAEQRIEYLATHDPVTDLPNRRWMMDELPRSLSRVARRGEKLAVLYLDLDGFKSINDLHGHQVGDRVLATVARRITNTVRAVDLVSRVGGDEFVILLENVADADAAARVGDKLVAAIDAPMTDVWSDARVGASIGIGLYPDDAACADSLIQVADRAMYVAKFSGGGRVVKAA